MIYLKYRDPHEHSTKNVIATPTNMFTFCFLCGSEVQLTKDEILQNPAVCIRPYVCQECHEALFNAGDVDPFGCDEKEDPNNEHDAKCQVVYHEDEQYQDAQGNAPGDNEGGDAAEEERAGFPFEAVLPELIRMVVRSQHHRD